MRTIIITLILAIAFLAGCSKKNEYSLGKELIEGQYKFTIESRGDTLYIPTVMDQQISISQIIKIIPIKDTTVFYYSKELSDTLRYDALKIWKPEKGVAVIIGKNADNEKRIYDILLNGFDPERKESYYGALTIEQQK